MAEERQTLIELIELYRSLPCLWDQRCEAYKDNNQRLVGWHILLSKLKKMDPDANIVSVKKKMDNLKSSYKREVRKVQNSKRKGLASSEVHKPNLWYFKLLTFLDEKHEQPWPGVNVLTSDDQSDDDSQHTQATLAGKKRPHGIQIKYQETNKMKVIENDQDLPQPSKSKKPSNAFAVYVGEKLDSLSTNQRQIAEKLISDVLFLGKTANLNFYSRVESQNGPASVWLSNSPRSPSPEHILSSPHYLAGSPDHSPEHSPSSNTSESPPSPQQLQSPQLMQLLTRKKNK